MAHGVATGSITLKRVPARRINPAPYNPRQDLKPGDPEYERLARSIDEFGCVEPLVWNKRTGHLVGGHQRLKILIARGAEEVDVSVVDLPLAREKILNVALNRISGDWDERKLAELLDELTRAPDLDVTLTGFDLPEVRDLIADALGDDARREEDFDELAALEAARRGPTVIKPGELIVLGRDPEFSHRLLCGDCTDVTQVRRLMQGQRAVLCASDPPYLVGYDGTNHPGSKCGTKNKNWSATYGVTWDDAESNPQLYERFLGVAVAEAIQRNAALYIWHASRRQAMLEAAMVKAGAFVHCQIIWTKNRPVLTRTWYAWQHEPCLMGWIKGHKPPRRPRRNGEPVPSTVWKLDTIPNGPERPDHPTPKPLELFAIPMRQHTRAGEICYEPIAGSGTQIISAQRLKRRCFALEVSPVYCDVIVRRFIAFAGRDAVAPALARRYANAKAARS
ncbi:MAG: site-specific DNA-methyltransferase [Phycisphaerales bacterium]